MANNIRVRNVAQKTGSWFKNISRSSMLVSKEIITDMIPSTIDIGKEFSSSVYDITDQFKTTTSIGKYAKVANKSLEDAFKNAKEQIKSGKIAGFSNGSDDYGFGDLEDFDLDDIIVFDEDDDITISSDAKVSSTATIEMGKLETRAINAQTSILSNVITAANNNSNKISVANNQAIHQVGVQMTKGLSAINDNLSMIVRFQSETMSSYVAASYKYYEDNLKMMSSLAEMQRHMYSSGKKDNVTAFGNSVLSSSTGIDFQKYFEGVKKNLKNSGDSNMLVTMAGIMLNQPEMLAEYTNNPLSPLMKMAMKQFIPSNVKRSANKFDNTFKNFLPAALNKIGSLRNRWDNPILQMIGETLGVKTDIKSSVDLSNRELTTPFAKIESKIDVSNTYLRKILSAITQTPEMIYDDASHKFKNYRDVKNDFIKDEKREMLGVDLSSSISSLMDAIDSVVNFKNVNDRGKTKTEIEDYFIRYAKSGKMPDKLSSRKDIEDLINSDSELNPAVARILIPALSALPKSQKLDLFGTGMISARERQKAFMENIENNASVYDLLFNGAESDKRMKNAGKTPTNGFIKASEDGYVFKDKVDQYGNSMFDYMRDIKTILLKGIRVFPLYRHINPSDHGPKPTDYLDKMLRDMGEEYRLYTPKKSDADFYASSNDYAAKQGKITIEGLEDLIYQNDKDLEEKMRHNIQVENGEFDIENPGFFKRSAKFLSNKSGLRKFGPAKKIANVFGKTGDIVAGTFNDLDELMFNVIFGMDTTKGNSFFHDFQTEMRGIFTNFKKSVSEDLLGKEYKEGEKGAGVVNTAISTVSDGFKDLRKDLFGKETDSSVSTLTELGEAVREKAPKTAAVGVAAGGAALMGGSLGLLPALFLPGGPIGAAIVGSTVGLLSQSEKMKNIVFGEKDPEGQRIGGIVSRDYQNFFKDKKKGVMIGAGAGFIKSMVMGNGLLTSTLLGSGPIGGALLGAGLGIAMSGDKFKDLLFGKMNEDGKRDDSGIFKKIQSSFTKGMDKASGGKITTKMIGKTSAGMLSGAALSGVIGQMGMLGALATMGGSPILGALVGAATGITLSSEKWTKAIFGEVDEETGKRKGGKMGQISNWLKTSVGDPLAIKIDEYKLGVDTWFTEKFADPLQQAIDPLVSNLKSAVSTTTDFITSGMKSLWNNTFGNLWNKKDGQDGLVKKFTKGALGAADFGIRKTGTLLGATLTAPIHGTEKLANFWNEHALNKRYKRELKEVYQTGSITKAEYKERKRDKEAKAAYFETMMGYTPDYMKKREHTLSASWLETKEQKRAALEERKQQLKLRQEMAKQLGYKDFDEAGKDISWLYGNDVKYERDEDGKIRAKKIAPESQELQVTQNIDTTVTSIDQKLEKVVDNLIQANTNINSSTDRIIKQAEDEDKGDDAQLYEVNGYDPVTGLKRRQRKDIDYYNSMKKVEKEDSKDASVAGPEGDHTSEEGPLWSMVKNFFSQQGGILGTISAGGAVAAAMVFANKMLNNDSEARTDADGTTIKNNAHDGTYAVERIFGKKMAKSFTKSALTNENGVARAVVESAGKYATKVKDGAKSLAKTGAEKLGKTSVGIAVKDTAKSASKKIGQEVAEKGAKIASSEMGEKFIKLCTSATEKFFASKAAVKQLGEKASKTAAAKLVTLLKEKLAKLLTNSTVLKRMASGISETVGKAVAGAATFGVVTAGFAVYDFVSGSGKDDTADLFKVEMDEVTTTMRIISGAIKALFGFAPIIDVASEILAEFSSFNLKTKIAELLLKAINGEQYDNLLANQKDFKAQLDKYNEKNNTNLSLEAYSDKVNVNTKTPWYKKAWSSVTNVGSKIATGITTSAAMPGSWFGSTFGKGKRGSQNQMAGKGTEPGMVNDFAYFSQKDDRYANYEYKPSPNTGMSSFSDPYISQRGCGVTSAAMVVSQLTGKKVDPTVMADYSTEVGTSVDAGTGWGFFDKVGQKYGLNVTQTDVTNDTLNAVTPQTPMIISGTGGNLFYGGHYVVGVKGGDGKITINDPLSSSTSKTYSTSQIAPYAKMGWVFSGGEGGYTPDSNTNDSTTSSSSSNNPFDFSILSSMGTALANALLFGKELDLSWANGTSVDSSSSSGSTSSAASDGNDRHRLSYLSTKFETGGYDPAAYGYDSGGGASYGLFQFANASGGLSGFMSYLKSANPKIYSRLSKHSQGSDAFTNEWKAIASDSREDFITAQENYAKQNYYDPVASGAPSANIAGRNIAVQEMALSAGVQHGSGGAKNIFNDVIGRIGANAADSKLIDAVYDERKLYTSNLTSSEREAVVNRFNNEKALALEILKETGGKGAVAKKTAGNANILRSLKKIKPSQLSDPKLMNLLAAKGSTGTGYHESFSVPDSVKQYIGNSGTDKTEILLEKVINILSNIEGYSASTVNGISALKQLQANSSINSLTTNTNNVIQNGNGQQKTTSSNNNMVRDRKNGLAKAQAIAAGGFIR